MLQRVTWCIFSEHILGVLCEPTKSCLLVDATEELECKGIRHSRALMEHNILLKVHMVHGVLDVSALSPY